MKVRRLESESATLTADKKVRRLEDKKENGKRK